MTGWMNEWMGEGARQQWKGSGDADADDDTRNTVSPV